MDNLEKINETLFEDIKHIDEYGNEYWLARELMSALEYDKWNNFHSVIKHVQTTKILLKSVISMILPRSAKSYRQAHYQEK